MVRIHLTAPPSCQIAPPTLNLEKKKLLCIYQHSASLNLYNSEQARAVYMRALHFLML